MLKNRLERAATLRGRGCTEGLGVDKPMVSNTAIACDVCLPKIPSALNQLLLTRFRW
jgi:hypothetical protein